MSFLSEIKGKCSAGHWDAMNWARNSCNPGFLQSRGRHFKVVKGDQVIAGEADSWEWDGTGKALNEAIAYAKAEQADTLYIDGGINWRENLRDGDYDPWVAEWSVTVWSSDGAEGSVLISAKEEAL
jgi:hypothetical protein